MRRGFSTVIAGGLIIFTLSILATVYLLYLDANQYRLDQTGRSISTNLKRESEMLHLSIEGGRIHLRNIGSTPVKIKYIAQKTTSGLKFKEVNLSIDVGKEVVIDDIAVEPANILFISSRGKVFTLNNFSSQAVLENNIFEWVNTSYFTLNIPLNTSESFYPIENSILVIHSRDYGYIVADMYRGMILYQGWSLIIPSRDGGVIYADGNVYIGNREVLSVYYDLKYVGYNYLVVSGLGNVYIVTSDGSLHRYSSTASYPMVYYNGDNLVIVGFIGEVGNVYRYYIAQISPFNYSLVSYDYLDLPIKFSDYVPSNIHLPGGSLSYLTRPSHSLGLIGITSYKINIKSDIHHVFSSALNKIGGSLSWTFKYWYFNIDGNIRNSPIDYVKALSTLDKGLPMNWEVVVSRDETPYSDVDIRVYNLSTYTGFLSIDSELIYGRSGFQDIGEHSYKYILSGDKDFLEIDLKILYSDNGMLFNVSIFSLIPYRELLSTYKGRVARPIISLNLYLDKYTGKGVLHIYEKSIYNPYVDSLMFEFQKPYSNILLKVVNSTEVLETSNYQYSRMEVRVFVANKNGFYINPSSLDYIVDGEMDQDSIFLSSTLAVVGGKNIKLGYVNESISFHVKYGGLTSRFASSNKITLPSMGVNILSNVDSVGLYIIRESGILWYDITMGERYDWEVITYNLLYVVVSKRFGGVDIYVYKY